MPQYLVANYLPDDFDPSTVTEAMMEEIHALNREMIAAGVRKFACGISPAGNAKTLRAQPDGKVLVTDGPYTETKEHMGGFWILECADMDEALAWAKKGAIACDVAGEVRELLFFPAPKRTQRNEVTTGRTAASEHAAVSCRMNEPAQSSAAGSHRGRKRRRTMKYLCFGYYDKGKFDGMTEAERNAMFDTCFEYDDHLRASGHWAGGEALQPPETALTLYWKNGKVATTDGPYAETKEQLGGILVLEARDMNHAVQLIGQHPASDVWQYFRDSASRGHERNHEGKRAATETGR